MKIRNRNFRKPKETPNFWPSFTDVMSTIVLVLFFLIFLAYFQQIVSITNWNARLNDTKMELSKREDELETKKLEISEKEDALRILAHAEEELKAEVEQGQIELMLSAKKLYEQEKIIANSNEELGNLRAKLQNISVLRASVLQKVKESIEDEIGTSIDTKGQPLVSIGDNANLVINNSFLFASGSANISEDGKRLLIRFAYAFEKVLDDEEIRRSIDSINIEGHADTDSDWQFNYELSCKRAYAVVNTMLKYNPNLEKKYGNNFEETGF